MSKVYSVYLLRYFPRIYRCLRGNNKRSKETILIIVVVVVVEKGMETRILFFSDRIAEPEDEWDLRKF